MKQIVLYSILMGICIASVSGAVQPANLSGFANTMNPNYVATIAISGTDSSVINAGGMVLCGVLLPAAFTGTALTFKASVDGTNFFVIKSTTSGTTLSYTVAQGTYVAIDPKDFQGVRYLKIISGSTESAARTLAVSLKGL